MITTPKFFSAIVILHLESILLEVAPRWRKFRKAKDKLQDIIID